jgi:integrase
MLGIQVKNSYRTADILNRTRGKPLHLWSLGTLVDQPISSHSQWGDRLWIFDNDTPGADLGQSTIRWEFLLPDGRSLLDPHHAALDDLWRRAVWSAIAAPGDGARPLAGGTVGVLSTSIRYFASWMVSKHVIGPSEFTPAVVREYISDLEADIEDEEGESQSIPEIFCRLRLKPLSLLWRQRFALQRVGIAPMPAPPFGYGAASLNAVANRLAASAVGGYRPLPDEVAIPVLNTALNFLAGPADDVIRLVEACEAAYAEGSEESGAKTEEGVRVAASKRMNAAACSFKFSLVGDRPWHRPLDPNDWDITEVNAVESQLIEELAQRRAIWAALDPKARRPTLPVGEPGRNRVPHLDLRRLVVDLGRPPTDESMLTCHPRLHAIVSKSAAEQGLFVPFTGTVQRVRQLVLAVVSAAHAVIQGTTGMRISEICALPAGIDDQTGLPACVARTVSTSGLGVIYTAKAQLSKTEATPRQVEWTLGYHLAVLPPAQRLEGQCQTDDEVALRPPAIRAMLVVDRLLRPYRTMLSANTLFITFKAKNGLPRSGDGISVIKSSFLRRGLKDFIAEWVDLTGLPDEARYKTMDRELVPYRDSHGRNVKTHQFRKLLANFAYRVDRALLPDLQMHFHHASMAMTERHYAAATRDWLPDMNDAAKQRAALLALDVARGVSPLAGRHGDDLQEQIANELGPRIEGLSTEKAYAEAFAYVDDPGFRKILEEPYGLCGARAASEMACHEEAGTVDIARWAYRLKPNYDSRTPSLCAGCRSFAVARWHLPYWEDRYLEHAGSLQVLQLLNGGNPLRDDDSYVLRTSVMANQARALCLKLGADMTDLARRLAVWVSARAYA